MTNEKKIRELATVDPWAERIVWILDGLFRVPGTNVRFGIDPILGLVFPGFGDATSGMFSLYLLFAALRRGVPLGVVFQMGWNLALDAILGAVPVVGDLFDFAFKANDRNLALLKAHATGKPAGPLAWLAVLGAAISLACLFLLPIAIVLWGITASCSG